MTNLELKEALEKLRDECISSGNYDDAQSKAIQRIMDAVDTL